MTLARRSLVGAGAVAGLGLLDWRTATAASDGTLTIALPNNPATLDPIQTSNHDGMVITNAIFENLMEVNLDWEVVPSLAHRMAVSDDALRFTFDLRDDVQFQNGAAFTAADVKYSYDYMLDPKNKSIRRTLFSPIQQITVETPTRVVFELRHPYRPWLQYMTKFMGVFPNGSREAVSDDAFKSAPVKLGTGPGIFVEWQPDTQITLQRNPAYWRKGVPSWQRVVAKIVPEDASRLAYLMTGQAQVISAPPPRDFARLKDGTPGIHAASKVALGGMWFMQTNTKRAPFDDVNFRKAVSCAIDRAAIARDVFYDLLNPTATPAPTVASYYNAAADKAVGYDPARARDFLAKSRHADKPEFELLVQSTPYLFDAKDAAVVIQSQLAAVGITAKLTPMEMPQVLSRAIAGTQTASMLPLMAPSDPTFIIQLCYTANQLMTKSSGYTNPALDAAIQESYRYTDGAPLDAVLKRIQDILVEDCPNVWLGFVTVANAWRDEVKGFRPNTGLTIEVRDVSVA